MSDSSFPPAFPPPNPATDAPSVTHTTDHGPPTRPVDAPMWLDAPVAPATTGMRSIPLFVLAVAAALAVGVAVGIAAGFAIFSGSAASCSPSDGWCDLGAAVVGALAGLAVGAIAYIVTAVLVVRRHRPPGARADHIAAVIVFPPGVLTVLTLIAQIVGSR